MSSIFLEKKVSGTGFDILTELISNSVHKKWKHHQVLYINLEEYEGGSIMEILIQTMTWVFESTIVVIFSALHLKKGKKIWKLNLKQELLYKGMATLTVSNAKDQKGTSVIK